MQTWQFIWMLAAVTGIAAAGLTGSGWALVTGERPTIWLLSTYSVATPLRIAALVIYAPLATIRTGIDYFGENPVLAVIFAAIGLFWSFVQGVFILTTVFAFT
ncbi:MAG TPA: hypothetical protein P5337_02830 [Aestuariivirga sp.]|nr:hypothetical protein [Alphaproteobacteria bacterium]HRX35306.1 hypothetical protein [Aestuariivirga sp.]